MRGTIWRVFVVNNVLGNCWRKVLGIPIGYAE